MRNICWLRITDYMRGWARAALGSAKRIKDAPVLDLHRLNGVEQVLLMPADDELPGFGMPGNVMCDTWHAALMAGLEMDPLDMEREFGITNEVLEQYLPVICPDYAIDEDGAIRPWDSNTCFGKQQAIALLRLIRDTFWSAVGNYASEYRKVHFGTKYAQIDMLESFCMDYHIDDTCIEAMRREWQRRSKKGG